MKKKGGNRKRVVYLRGGGFLYSCVLLRFGNTFRLMPSSAPPSREPPLQVKLLSSKHDFIFYFFKNTFFHSRS
jgi:hypothetical protein